jgi:hypothetical protein
VFHVEGRELGPDRLIVSEDVWPLDHIEEVLPVRRHVPPQFSRQNQRMLQISQLVIHFADRDTVNEILL